jgi:hypothetical protein
VNSTVPVSGSAVTALCHRSNSVLTLKATHSQIIGASTQPSSIGAHGLARLRTCLQTSDYMAILH